MNKPKVTQLTENSFEVLGHHVILTKKKGRTLLLCNCTNSGRFGDANFCWDKELVIEYMVTKKVRDKLDKLIKLYQNWCDAQLPQNPSLMLNDLKNLRRML